MKTKLLPGVIGGIIGFLVGVFSGGYLGLVIGGTFLGGLNIYEQTGFEGYELAPYVGAAIGAIIVTILGVKLALRIDAKHKNKR